MEEKGYPQLLLWFFESSKNKSRPTTLLTSFLSKEDIFQVIQINKLINENASCFNIHEPIPINKLIIVQEEEEGKEEQKERVQIRKTKVKVKIIFPTIRKEIDLFLKYYDLFTTIHDCITHLCFSLMKITHEDILVLCKFLETNKTVSFINLSGNRIGDQGIIPLFNLLKTNKTIRDINLRWNRIGNAGIRALSEMLTINTSLTYLDLSDNKVTDEGAILLAEALKVNKDLKYINLLTNREIGYEGAVALNSIKESNKNLAFLSGTKLKSFKKY